ncbi:hypothetical protein BG004_003607 [Podila humilis]|nr:hypothetical protein BG004_003607 [Podila humilis]
MVLPAVMCQTGAAADDDDKIYDPAEASELMCKDKEQSADWYKCISCCQGLLPYYTKGDRNPFDDARYSAYKSKDLSALTLPSMCNDPASFAQRFKAAELDLKLEQKPCCVTEDGTNEFMNKKTKCFFECEKNPVDLNYCKSVSEWSVKYVNDAPTETPTYHGKVRGKFCKTAKDKQGCCMFQPSANAALENVCPSAAPASYVCKSDADTCLVIDPQRFRTFCPDEQTNFEASYTRPRPGKILDPLNIYIQDIYTCTWEREALGSPQQIAAETAYKNWCTSLKGKLFAVDKPFCECRNLNTIKTGESKLEKFQRECATFKGTWSTDAVSPAP